MTALSVNDLVVEFPSASGSALRVLDGLSFRVEPGELFALIGPSGCGKTTFLNAVAGLCRPNRGHIEPRGPALRCAIVFQKPTLLPWRTVVDNALFGLECRGDITARQRASAIDMLESMGLGAHLSDRPHHLSEGEKQRVNLARALLVEPDVLLLDEPFAALDLITRRQLQDDLLERCKARDITAVLVSHSLEDVAYLSDKVAVLSDKPTRVIDVRAIDLPHPRTDGPKARMSLMQIVDDLSRLMR